MADVNVTSLFLNLRSLYFSLSDLEKFIIVVEAGLSQTVEEGNYTSLVEVMGHLLAVKERQNATDTMFEPLQHTIALLKVYEQELPDVVYKQLEVNCPSSTSHSFPQPIFSQLRQTHCFFFVSYNCPSSLYSPAHSCLLHVSLSPFISLSLHLTFYLTVTPQELPERWNSVRKQAAVVKQKVAPLQATEVVSLRRKCTAFDVEQCTFRVNFRNHGPFRYK